MKRLLYLNPLLGAAVIASPLFVLAGFVAWALSGELGALIAFLIGVVIGDLVVLAIYARTEKGST